MTPLQKSILNAVKRRPMTLREMQNNLQVDNSRLRTTVSAMVATGELSMRNGTYVPGFATYENAAAPNTIPCTLVKLAARFGFASRDDGEGDIFIPGRALHGAMPNDKINVKLFDHPRVEGSSEGEVVEVTVPNNRFAGTVCLSEDGRMAVEPDGCRDVKFLLAKQGSEGVHLGDKVGFLITHRGNRHSDHRAAVVEKFGSSDYASECAKAILYGRSVRQEFPPEVLEEARAYDNATIDPAEAAKRLDLRGIPIFTIDSAETKDIDASNSQQQLAHAVGGGLRRMQVRSGQRQSCGGCQLHNGGAVRQQAVKPRRRAAIGARAGAFDPLAAAGRQKRLHRTLAAVGQGDGEHLCPGIRPPDGLPGHGAEVPGGQGALEGIGDENVFVHIAPPGVACCP